jgi:P-type Ca2+ transporter type 2C
MHTQSVKTALETLETSIIAGLNTQQIEKRLEKYGPNSLPEPKRTPLYVKFLAQFTDILVVVLIAAAVISAFFGERLDAIVIGVIVVINATLGFIQEARAEKAIEALRKLSTDYAKVIRNSEIQQIKVAELVPGDILLLETGDKIPADARLVETVRLQISEAVLTGESNPVNKNEEGTLELNTPLAERKNMVFKDTTILFGRGKAVVISTGLETEIGKISQMLAHEEKDDSPLAEQLDSVGKRLSLAAGAIVIVIFLLAILSGQANLQESFFTSISLAVAAIPEGLPAIVTIVLASGMSQLAKSNAIVKRLKAVETLGATDYILTDKTGTLTLNKMTVTNMVTPNIKCVVSHKGDCEDETGNKIDTNSEEELQQLLRVAVLCNDAEDSGEKLIGDPTETALLEVAKKMGMDIKEIRNEYKRVYEIPFSAETKKMLVVVRKPHTFDRFIVMAKGAPEIMQWLVTEENQMVQALNENLARYGLRNLALSYKEISKDAFEKAKELDNPEEVLSEFHSFVGIISQKDPIRKEVKVALEKATQAGVKTIVLTGDNKLTATNVAMELELIESEKEVMDGTELGDTNGKELDRILTRIKVFARVTPEQKLRITNAIKDQGFIVAVTGDGVNDAPAIKAADIGISMGITGTDVSKEVADMVLQDDNYATIVEAIKDGRVIYDNLVKFIRYLISCNLSEVTIIAISVLAGLPLPLLPIHILWINLVTDGLPALVLGVDTAESDIMAREPRNANDHLLNKRRWVRMSVESLFISAATLIVFIIGLRTSLNVARTAAFVTLVFSQLAHALNNRSEEHSIFSRQLKPNYTLLATLLGSALLQMVVVYTPIGETLLSTVKLNTTLLGAGMGFSLLPIIGTEMLKAFPRKSINERITSVWEA